MASLSSLIIGILALTVASIGFTTTHSGILTILLAVAVVLIGKSLQPFFMMLWGKFLCRFFPLPELREFEVRRLHDMDGLDGAPPLARGMRVLAMTEFLELGPKTKPLYQEMTASSLEALSQKFPLFALRWNTVQRRKFPEQYVCALCGKDGENMRKCVKAWFQSDALRNMRSRAQERDLFLHDGEITVSGEDEPVRYTVMVLFDGQLPVTLPKPATETDPA